MTAAPLGNLPWLIAPTTRGFLRMASTLRPTMLDRIRTLLELIRFSHTIFALPFAMLSAIVAWSLPDTTFRWQELVGILLCMVFARSAAMAFNRLVDRDVDAENPRTAGRHIPAGLISVRSVTVFTLTCSLGFIASTLLFLPNRWPIYLSVPVLLFLLGYSYAKRWTCLLYTSPSPRDQRGSRMPSSA